ncbi:hypothetical protein HTK96_09705 [Brevundimonas vesicularis]|uniref:hypothetical protein n=1 Tax=Brevundimonas vesicularis TaxID=41276 RepID=UPI0015724200|nr:hypothetical protein [Brevundimonas vesicularis]NSX33641.1 hypothetical protein [Brevundimonas vesicularis]
MKSTALLRRQARNHACAVDFSVIGRLHDRFSPLESVAVTQRLTKAMTLKTTGFGGAVSGARTV